jgi:hypothetical protein
MCSVGAFVDRIFEDVDVRGGQEIFGHVLRRCTFRVCQPFAEDVVRRPIFRRLRIDDCTAESCDAHGAVFDECVVDGLRTNRLHMVTGCAFRHVVLRGSIGQFLVRGSSTGRTDDALDRANAAFYRQVDWALDITEARSTTLDIGDIPLDLIRRDLQTQPIVRRASFTYEELVRLGIGARASQILSLFAADGPDRRLYVANARSKRFAEDVEAIQQLRGLGLVE